MSDEAAAGGESGGTAAGADTIAAIATAPGVAAVGVLRLSGPQAGVIAQRLCGRLPPPRHAALRTLRDGDGVDLDRGLVLWFPAPGSYTGENLVELQVHGGPVLLTVLLELACAHGARLAAPGEFTERAFINGRLDLAQAEAVADLIEAGSRAAARAAARSLAGELSRRVQTLAAATLALRAYVEGALDFAEDDVDWLSTGELAGRLQSLQQQIEETMAAAQVGQRLREGLRVAIVGCPNAGKSTLMNALLGMEAAIVTDRPGTTRDLLREQLMLDGAQLQLCDTAGLRDTEDPVEAEGVRRAWRAAEDADLLLWLIDDREADRTESVDSLWPRLATRRRLRIFSKCDLTGRPPGPADDTRGAALRLSATTGAGMDALRRALRRAVDEHVGGAGAESTLFTARARHVAALARAAEQVERARRTLRDHGAAELAAEELRIAHAALGEITGAVGAEELLAQIFGSFCIGK